MTWIWTVFSSAFPGPQMPWNNNSSLQLQDMYDQVYSHLIGTLKDRDTILQILGQVIIAQDLPPNVDAFGPPPNSSPKWIAAILDLKYDRVIKIVTGLHLLLEVGNRDEDIRIRHPSFIEFLLDQTRSRELFVDVNEALSVLRETPVIIRWIFNTEGM